jgi:pyruvate/2-oxoglutarate/acetoin dehydrogenase E1 component
MQTTYIVGIDAKYTTKTQSDSNDMRQIYYSHAIREALEEELERDSSVILLGEDIAEYGGAFKVTAGIANRFGRERVRNTPICENGFVGVAVGAAITGLRPVVEIMFMDFITLAMDQIVNHAAKFRYQFGPQCKVPLTVRCPAGAGRGYGPTHSQSLERYFVATPGLIVLAPSTATDAKGLLKSAIRCDDPVIFIESKLLYPTMDSVPEDEYLTPIGKAAIRAEGDDITIVAYSRMVSEALKAAEALSTHGVSCEVIDLRTLSPLDMACITESVNKTGRAVVVEEGWLTGGIGAELASRICQDCFDTLLAAPRRVAAADIPVPASMLLEQAATPDFRDIARAAAELMASS